MWRGLAAFLIAAVAPMAAGLAGPAAAADAGAWSFDFEDRRSLWEVGGWDEKYASVRLSGERAHSGSGSLEVKVQLGARHRSAEVSGLLRPPRQLTGKTLSLWLWAPPGARGNAELPNTVQPFLEDAEQRRAWGTSRNLIEGGWFEVTFPIAEAPLTCDTVEARFDASRVRRVGLNIALGRDPQAALDGALFLDHVIAAEGAAAGRSPVESRASAEPRPSAHLYRFDGLPVATRAGKHRPTGSGRPRPGGRLTCATGTCVPRPASVRGASRRRARVPSPSPTPGPGSQGDDRRGRVA